MYVFKHVESNLYFSGSGWYTKLTDNIAEARVFQKPQAAYPTVRHNGRVLHKREFSTVPVEIREVRDLTDTGEEE